MNIDIIKIIKGEWFILSHLKKSDKIGIIINVILFCIVLYCIEIYIL